MELMEGLLTRRSVRQFQEKEVSVSDVKEIVKAGMYAPSARNQQVWRFVVDTDKERLAAISEKLPTARMAKEAAFAIVVCVDTEQLASPDYWIQDCSAAMENMLLACHAKDMGGVWVGLYPKSDREQALRDIYRIPQDVPVAALLIGGYPAKELPKVDRYDESRIYEGSWK